MRRIYEILGELRNRYPNDDFFCNFEESCLISPEKKFYNNLYNKALMVLDDSSWHILKNKALEHYRNHRNGQMKQGFFNQLNEAFAYRYLVGRGFNDVCFIKEGNGKSPDIMFTVNNIQSYCEVKTLSISDDEITRRGRGTAFDCEVYVRLNEQFFKKFSEAIETAREQIKAYGTNGLIYILIKFDDFTLDYYQNYRKQLISFSKKHGFNNLFIKIGLRGNRRIFLTSNSGE
jgi:hypothetical protein